MIQIRLLTTLDEFESVLRLQEQIWGFPDLELLPPRIFVVIHKIGGHAFGAFDADRMIGFCFAFPGVKPSGTPYLHSQMLGVLPEYHNAGIGRRLKLSQRDDALARGIHRMEWTFDPLELKNAFFNIERLGVIVRHYTENAYGITPSPLHGGLPTDRCVAEWLLDSDRVKCVLAGTPHPHRSVERITYPTNIGQIRATGPAKARQIQMKNGTKFQEAFARGLAVTGFERGERESAYLLEPWQ